MMERRFLITRLAIYLFLFGAVLFGALLAFLVTLGWQVWLPTLLILPIFLMYAVLFVREARLRVRIDASGVRAGRNFLAWEDIGHLCVVHLDGRPKTLLFAREVEQMPEAPPVETAERRIVLAHSKRTEALVCALYPGEVLRAYLRCAPKGTRTRKAVSGKDRVRMIARELRILLLVLGAAILLFSLYALTISDLERPEKVYKRLDIEFAWGVPPFALDYRFKAQDGSGYYIPKGAAAVFFREEFERDISPGDKLRLVVNAANPDASGRFPVYAISHGHIPYLDLNEVRRFYAERENPLPRLTRAGIPLGGAMLGAGILWQLLARRRALLDASAQN